MSKIVLKNVIRPIVKRRETIKYYTRIRTRHIISLNHTGAFVADRRGSVAPVVARHTPQARTGDKLVAAAAAGQAVCALASRRSGRFVTAPVGSRRIFNRRRRHRHRLVVVGVIGIFVKNNIFPRHYYRTCNVRKRRVFHLQSVLANYYNYYC